jgi:hypothetical protein
MKNKVKNAIKESKEEKDSLFKEIKFKSQAAMEYLMTYGWAILIIALTLAVLYSLGIMNPKNFLPRAPPGSCFVFRPNGPGTTDFVSLQGTCGYLPMYVGSFNGVNGRVNIPSSTGLMITSGTLVAWVKAIAEPPVEGEILWPTNIYSFVILHKPSGTFQGLVSTNGNSWTAIATKGGVIPLGSWVHLAATYDQSTGNLYIYVNGVQQASASSAGGAIYPNTGYNIGARNDGSYPFNGLIANVQIYNTALTPQEIQYLYQQGLGGAPVRLGSLVGWWPLNGDAKDYSGNNNHGTINGGVTFVQNYNPP